MTQSQNSTTKHYQQLTPEERGEIQAYVNAGESQAEIAVGLTVVVAPSHLKSGVVLFNSVILTISFSPNTLRIPAKFATKKPVKIAVSES